MRETLIAAAIESLREDGFVGASARNIARRAGCNQGLVFYHFGSVVNLLLAALDEVGNRRLGEYGAAVQGATTLPELVTAATRIFREDLDAGYLKVLSEMIAGASATPGLGEAIAERIAPWRAFAEDALTRALASSPIGAVIPAGVVAHAAVALYLGLELLADLDGDRAPTEALFAHATMLANLVSAL
jgi:AcrR family transcriptional regulator